ncbi:WD40 repeat domain-containing protein [Deinococcus lacus]|uniref:WD40 repeat domain-containing protein n=1 Tax=Deinococcus lacus TaxID=392561 RepID=A0ABW1YD35_9DEIO
MRPLLPALLLLCAPASAATLSSMTPIPGHAAGSFGPSEDFGPLAGGAAWSADGGTVWTLDTTRELKRWRVADGTLLRGQRLAAPARLPDERPDFPSTRLTLSGAANASGLPITARGYRNQTEVTLGYRLNTGSGAETLDEACPPSLSSGLTCTPGGAAQAWVEGGEVRWQRGAGGVARLPLPADSALQQVRGELPFGLSLSPDGGRLALLLLESKDVASGSKGTLLTWTLDAQGAAQLTRTPLSGPLLHPGAHLNWVGGRVLVASNVYNTGDEFGSGGSQQGQRLMLVKPGEGVVWALDAAAGLRGADPSPDGSLFVTVRDGSVPELRRVSDGRFVRSLGAAVRDAVPLGGGRTLLAVQDGAGLGRIVRHAPGRLDTLYRGPQVPQHLAATRDGARIATAGGDDVRTLRLLDASGRVLREWRADGRVLALAFSPDGQVLSTRILENYLLNGVPNVREAVQAWRVTDGTAYPLPTGAQFPVSQVIIRQEEGRQNGNYRSRYWITERATGRTLWQTPWHSAWFGALASPGENGWPRAATHRLR